MRNSHPLLAIFFGVVVGVAGPLTFAATVTSEAGCSPAANHVVKDVLDVLLPGAVAKCVAENVDLDDDALQEKCKYGDELRLAAHRLKQAGLTGAARVYRSDAGK